MSEVLEQELPEGEQAKKAVVIPYKPRVHFLPMHNSPKRWKFVVAHRRAGKSVSEINEVIKRALQNKRVDPPPRYAYVGPSFDQTKDLIWGYLKHYTSVIPGVKVSEGDLEVVLPNGAKIRLYGGAAAYERMRGLYFDGIVLDEFPLLNPAVFSTVVRPCLADYRGWAIISGTSNGDDHFHALKKKNEFNPNWDFFIIPVNKTDALHPDEVVEMTADMTPEEYAREMMCSFDAPIEGSYYGDLINDLMLKKQITKVPHDPAARVVTWWDLGIHDNMSIWFVQRVGRELHVIDFYQNSGHGLEHYVDVLDKRREEFKYKYGAHVLPHDIMARELGTGKSRYEVLAGLLEDIFVCPVARVEDGIQAVRSTLPLCWIDEEKCLAGLSALKGYQKSKMGKPVHNWASHPADAFRVGATAVNHVFGFLASSNVISMTGALKRNVRGVV